MLNPLYAINPNFIGNTIKYKNFCFNPILSFVVQKKKNRGTNCSSGFVFDSGSQSSPPQFSLTFSLIFLDSVTNAQSTEGEREKPNGPENNIKTTNSGLHDL